MSTLNWLKKLENRESLFYSLPMIVRFLVALLSVLLAAFVGVMFSDCAAENIGVIPRANQKSRCFSPKKNEILKFLGIGMGGILARHSSGAVLHPG